MKKSWMLFLFFAAFAALTFSGCSDDDNSDAPENTHLVSKEVQAAFNAKYPQAKDVEWELKGDYAVVDFYWDGGEHSAWFNPLSAAWYMTETDVRYENLPEPVLAAFNAKYPQAKDVEWELKGDYAVVDFYWDGGEHSAWFNPLSAAWYMTETDVRYENLPEPVLAAHKAGKYADWRVDDVDKLTREGMETLYVIEVEKGESELDLFYSSTGILVKTVVDTGHEEDYDDYLPQPDANGIIAIVKQKYPNATIVEIEREKGLQEVTILDENKEKEVYFNERNEWMGTSWDVQVANLPEAVKKSVMEKYSDYVIDDADYVVTPDNEWYILDLENKQIDKELKVKVDKDGVWL